MQISNQYQYPPKGLHKSLWNVAGGDWRSGLRRETTTNDFLIGKILAWTGFCFVKKGWKSGTRVCMCHSIRVEPDAYNNNAHVCAFGTRSVFPFNAMMAAGVVSLILKLKKKKKDQIAPSTEDSGVCLSVGLLRLCETKCRLNESHICASASFLVVATLLCVGSWSTVKEFEWNRRGALFSTLQQTEKKIKIIT